jgi:hypothetical protein
MVLLKFTRPHALVIVLLFVFLIVTSAAIIYTTGQNMASVKSLALQSLYATAFSLSSSAEGLLREQSRISERELREILADRVVAYALIIGKDGVIRNQISNIQKKGHAYGPGDGTGNRDAVCSRVTVAGSNNGR